MRQLFLAFVIFLISIPVFSQSTAEDDNENGTSLVPILIDVAPLIEELEEKKIEIVRMEIDILKTKKTTSRILHADWAYGIAIVGDYRFTNLDLKVYKMVEGNKILINEDMDEDKAAVVVIEPEKTEEYIIEIIGTETAEGYVGGHYALLIFHE